MYDRQFRDVVFEDVGFEHNILKPLTHISFFRCEVPKTSVPRAGGHSRAGCNQGAVLLRA